MLYIIDVIILEDTIHKKDILVYDDILNASERLWKPANIESRCQKSNAPFLDANMLLQT